MIDILKRSDRAAAYYGMTRWQFDQLPGYKRLEMIEASEGKTYLSGQYDLLDDVQQDVNAASLRNYFKGFAGAARLGAWLLIAGAAGAAWYFCKDDIKAAIK